MLADGDTAKITQTCEATLRQNWREGVRATDRVPFAYTCPSPSHYPWQWYWDSCFAAIMWRHFDPTRSRRELEVAAGGAARGRVHRPHDLLEHAADGPPAVHLQRDLAERLDDREHPAAVAGVGVADRGRRPGDRARNRPPLRLAEREPRPRRRRADLDRAARRVRTRRLAAIRRGLGPARPRPARVHIPRPAQPQARIRPQADQRGRRAGVLRGRDECPPRAVAAGARTAVADADDRRADVRRDERAVRAARPPRTQANAGAHVGCARAPGAAGPAGTHRPAPG